jgi:NADH dehydrogenase
MRVLVTGGTGVVGHGLIPALQGRGHQVRLLTRHADHDVREWRGVEPWEADVMDPASLLHAADGCGTVVHVTGIQTESPPEITFQKVNVDGTRRVVEEAERAEVPQLVYVSSLGAERGRSGYHRSKLEAEEFVRRFSRSWVVLRPGNVYGPDDPVVSPLLQMVRSLPLLPVVGGDKRFQPIWYEDLGGAIAETIGRYDLGGGTLELAGPDVTTVGELVERLKSLTSRSPRRISVSQRVAAAGAKLAEKLSLDGSFTRITGLELPLDTSQLTMLEEESFILPGSQNALQEVLGVTPTPLDEGLRRLTLELPEQLPHEGVGKLEHKSFWALIRGSDYDVPELMRIFRTEARELLPLEFVQQNGSPGGDGARPLDVDDTLTLHLPARGEIQVRVEEASDRRVTLATVEGHPLAGIVRFSLDRAGADLRFQIDVYTRSANLLDFVVMKLGGQAMQRSAWQTAVENVVSRSGGEAAEGVQHDKKKLDEEEAREVEAWVEDVVQARRRDVNARAAQR